MNYMKDLSAVGGMQSRLPTAENSTNTNAGNSLNMTDFLTLMVATFQNQDIDNTASTSEMMNQMVQMSVVEAITQISNLINDSTVMTYAASLVGKEVVVGQFVGGELKEISGTVTGTGTLNGQQVIFIGDDSYFLSDIMAVGKLPEKKPDVKPDENPDENPDVKPDNKPDENPDVKPDENPGGDSTGNSGGASK